MFTTDVKLERPPFLKYDLTSSISDKEDVYDEQGTTSSDTESEMVQ